jgi:hypothetical protein
MPDHDEDIPATQSYHSTFGTVNKKCLKGAGVECELSDQNSRHRKLLTKH